MYIQTESTATRRIGSADVRDRNDGDAIEFSDAGRARVTKQLGEYLANTRPDISIAEREDDDAADADTDDTDDTD